VIGIDSPVSIDSSTTTVPSMSTASDSIMTPPVAGMRTTSPGTRRTEDSSTAANREEFCNHLFYIYSLSLQVVEFLLPDQSISASRLLAQRPAVVPAPTQAQVPKCGYTPCSQTQGYMKINFHALNIGQNPVRI
jgi:hypothetical protein